jgi:hypothetical protein
VALAPGETAPSPSLGTASLSGPSVRRPAFDLPPYPYFHRRSSAEEIVVPDFVPAFVDVYGHPYGASVYHGHGHHHCRPPPSYEVAVRTRQATNSNSSASVTLHYHHLPRPVRHSRDSNDALIQPQQVRTFT